MEDFSYVWCVRQTPESLKALYENSKARVRVKDELTECFQVRKGLTQGRPLSPWLFNVFLDMVVRETRTQVKARVCLDNCTIKLLMFADDTVLLAETEEDLQHNAKEFSKAVKRHRKATTMVFTVVGSRWIVVWRWMARNWIRMEANIFGSDFE